MNQKDIFKVCLFLILVHMIYLSISIEVKGEIITVYVIATIGACIGAIVASFIFCLIVSDITLYK